VEQSLNGKFQITRRNLRVGRVALPLEPKNVRAKILAVTFLMLFLAILPTARSERPIINSVWTDSPPVIDGKFTPGEYADPQIVFQVPPYPDTFLNASVYFTNDKSTLYVLVDAVGDTTNNRDDETLFVFGFPPQTWIQFWGYGGFVCASPIPGCSVPQGVRGVVGYDTTPNSAQKHKLYEVSIPFKNFNAGPGQSVDFSSPKVGRKLSIAFDYATRRDNVWPKDLVLTKIETWGILGLAQASQPVSENVELLLPAGLILAATAVKVVRRRLPDRGPKLSK
jgi:hypothetical protein